LSSGIANIIFPTRLSHSLTTTAEMSVSTKILPDYSAVYIAYACVLVRTNQPAAYAAKPVCP